MNIHNRQSNKQVFFSLEFVNILLQMEVKAVQNASSLLYFSGHSELENGLLSLTISAPGSPPAVLFAPNASQQFNVFEL